MVTPFEDMVLVGHLMAAKLPKSTNSRHHNLDELIELRQDLGVKVSSLRFAKLAAVIRAYQREGEREKVWYQTHKLKFLSYSKTI